MYKRNSNSLIGLLILSRTYWKDSLMSLSENLAFPRKRTVLDFEGLN